MQTSYVLAIHLTQPTATYSVAVMEDYPKTIVEFEARFSQEAACREYLIQIRWPDGFRCPHCGANDVCRVREILFQCARCRKQTSVTAGTVFQDLRKPVPGHRVLDEPEERRRRIGYPADPGAGKLPDGVAVVAQTEKSYGQA